MVAADDDPAGYDLCFGWRGVGSSVLWTECSALLPVYDYHQRMAGESDFGLRRGLAEIAKILSAVDVDFHYSPFFVATIINIGWMFPRCPAAIKLLVPLPAIVIAVYFSLIVIVLIMSCHHSVITKIFEMDL